MPEPTPPENTLDPTRRNAQSRSSAAYEQAALDFAAAYTGDAEALGRFNAHCGR